MLNVSSILFFLQFVPLRIELFDDCVVEVFVGEECGPENHGEADGQDGAHEAAIDDGVHAILLSAPKIQG